MVMTEPYASVPIPGSHREPLPGAVRIRDVDAASTVSATAVLRRAPASADIPGTPADPDDVQVVREFASAAGIGVAGVNMAARSIRLRGSAPAMQAAFGVDLAEYEVDGLGYRGRVGSVYIPPNLDGVIVAVLGLDNRPSAHTHFRVAGMPSGTLPAAVAAPGAVSISYSPRAVAAAYGFPPDANGSGRTVAIIELGGGYSTDDLDVYFGGLGLATPSLEAVSVDGATNSPDGDADGEVMLDIEVIGAIAPAAAIAVYFGPNTTDGFYDAIAAAVHDNARQPSIVSISWGQAESGWTASQMDAYDALFADAAAASISVYAAAGDNGATDGDTDGGLHVDFPSSSPSVVGCGGTTLTASGGTIRSEVVWNELSSGNGATGGGLSSHFATPAYQTAIDVPGPGRGVPDVAGNADPVTGYEVRVDGRNVVIGGTSAVAPLWSGLTALANQINGTPAGAPHAVLYATPSAFRDITDGDNGGYSAGTGWDACTGLGSPRGDLIVGALGSSGFPPAPADGTGGAGAGLPPAPVSPAVPPVTPTSPAVPEPGDPSGDPARPGAAASAAAARALGEPPEEVHGVLPDEFSW
jgi:kumamolisin